MVERLLSKCKALSSNPSIAKKKKVADHCPYSLVSGQVLALRTGGPDFYPQHCKQNKTNNSGWAFQTCI
jgi:hypothetical protein